MWGNDLLSVFECSMRLHLKYAHQLISLDCLLTAPSYLHTHVLLSDILSTDAGQMELMLDEHAYRSKFSHVIYRFDHAISKLGDLISQIRLLHRINIQPFLLFVFCQLYFLKLYPYCYTFPFSFSIYLS